MAKIPDQIEVGVALVSIEEIQKRLVALGWKPPESRSTERTVGGVEVDMEPIRGPQFGPSEMVVFQVVSGEATMSVNGQTFTVHAGETLTIRP